MRNSLKMGAVVALVLVVAVALLGGAWSGMIDSTAMGNNSDDTSGAAGPPSGGDGLTDQNGGQGSDPTGCTVRLEFVSYPTNVTACTLGHYEVMVYNLDDNSPYTGDLLLLVQVSPSGSQIIGPSPGGTPGLYIFDLCFAQTGGFCVKVTPYDCNCNLIGDSIEVPVNVVASGSNGGGGDNQTTDTVRLEFSNYTFNLLAGDWAHYEVMAYNLDDGSPYTGDLSLAISIMPPYGVATGASPGDQPGLYTFTASGFNRTGEFVIKVTPYDLQGHVLGDPIEVTVNVVGWQGQCESIASNVTRGDNVTTFNLTLQVMLKDTWGNYLFDGCGVYLVVGDNTYPSIPVTYQGSGVYNASYEVPNSDYVPGDPYHFAVFNGNKQVGAVYGTTPGGSGPTNTAELMLFKEYSYPVVGYDLPFSITAVNPYNGSTYTEGLILEVEVTPSGGNATVPAFGEYQEYWFTVNFTQPGNYTVKVTPYDSQGNQIGDPVEMTVNAVTEGALENFSSIAYKQGDHTNIECGLTVAQYGVNWDPPIGVSYFTLTVDGTTYNMTNYGFQGLGTWYAILQLPNTDYTPGAGYTITAYDLTGQVLATTTGTAPS